MTTNAISRAVALTGLLSLPALAADAPPTAEVLAKLHHANQMEIQMGKLAVKNGQSKEVKEFGKMLVKDHSAADKKVTALARKEKVDLKKAAMKDETMADLPPKGPEFDAKFAQAMLDDHKKDVAETKAARDATDNAKLKQLLTDVVPTLEKHEETAQKIVDAQKK
jgi:putative membrane protein